LEDALKISGRERSDSTAKCVEVLGKGESVSVVSWEVGGGRTEADEREKGRKVFVWKSEVEP
jgi:hypothetical protein